MVAITIAMGGLLAYGAARSALASAISPDRILTFGPVVAIGALLLAGRSGAYQGPTSPGGCL